MINLPYVVQLVPFLPHIYSYLDKIFCSCPLGAHCTSSVQQSVCSCAGASLQLEKPCVVFFAATHKAGACRSELGKNKAGDATKRTLQRDELVGRYPPSCRYQKKD